jgi:hypothetical protein
VPTYQIISEDAERVVVSIPRVNAKSIHDLDAAFLRLEILKDLMQNKYDFTAPEAQGLLRQYDEAIEILKNVTGIFRSLYHP